LFVYFVLIIFNKSWTAGASLAVISLKKIYIHTTTIYINQVGVMEKITPLSPLDHFIPLYVNTITEINKDVDSMINLVFMLPIAITFFLLMDQPNASFGMQELHRNLKITGFRKQKKLQSKGGLNILPVQII
jgi:hypothetical protein